MVSVPLQWWYSTSFLVVVAKAMRWPKNFAISRKSKVESRIVSTVENRPKLSRLCFAFDFRERRSETTEIIENFDICQKFRYIFDIVDIRRYIYQKYTGIFDINHQFLTIFRAILTIFRAKIDDLCQKFRYIFDIYTV